MEQIFMNANSRRGQGLPQAVKKKSNLLTTHFEYFRYWQGCQRLAVKLLSSAKHTNRETEK